MERTFGSEEEDYKGTKDKNLFQQPLELCNLRLKVVEQIEGLSIVSYFSLDVRHDLVRWCRWLFDKNR